MSVIKKIFTGLVASMLLLGIVTAPLSAFADENGVKLITNVENQDNQFAITDIVVNVNEGGGYSIEGAFANGTDITYLDLPVEVIYEQLDAANKTVRLGSDSLASAVSFRAKSSYSFSYQGTIPVAVNPNTPLIFSVNVKDRAGRLVGYGVQYADVTAQNSGITIPAGVEKLLVNGESRPAQEFTKVARNDQLELQVPLKGGVNAVTLTPVLQIWQNRNVPGQEALITKKLPSLTLSANEDKLFSLKDLSLDKEAGNLTAYLNFEQDSKVVTRRIAFQMQREGTSALISGIYTKQGTIGTTDLSIPVSSIIIGTLSRDQKPLNVSLVLFNGSIEIGRKNFTITALYGDSPYEVAENFKLPLTSLYKQQDYRVTVVVAQDGVQDAGELGFAGQTIEVVDLTFELIASTVSAADGNYTITIPALKTAQILQVRQVPRIDGHTFTLPLNWAHEPEYVASDGSYTKGFGNILIGVAPVIASFTVDGDTSLSDSGDVTATVSAAWAGSEGVPGANCTIQRLSPRTPGIMTLPSAPFRFTTLTQQISMQFTHLQLFPTGSNGQAILNFRLSCTNATGTVTRDASATFCRTTIPSTNQGSNQTSTNQGPTNQTGGGTEVTTFCTAD